MREKLSDQTSCPEMAAFDDVFQLKEVGVFESLHEMVLSFDFVRLYWQKHLYGNLFLVLLVSPFEDVRITTPSHLMRYSILILLAG